MVSVQSHPLIGPVGECIYCGTQSGRLTDEHVLPYSLDGCLVLPQASCDSCAEITSRLEFTVAREMYELLRIKRDFKSRRKKRRPTHFAADVVDPQGQRSTTQIPTSVFPTSYVALELPPPGILTGAPKTTKNPEMKLHIKRDETEYNRALETLDLRAIGFRHKLDWASLLRFIAKVAHGYTRALVGKAGYEPTLPDLILGRSSHLSYIVGGGSVNPHPGEVAFALVPAGQDLYLTAFLTLMGRGRLPTYQAVAGLIRDETTVVQALVSRGYMLNSANDGA